MNLIKFTRLMIEIYKKNSLPNLDLIESYGLLAVKIAQHYALRVDFLPEENCRELSKLFRNNKKSKESSEIKTLIESYKDPYFLSIFEEFDTKPFATASIGQAHYAKLKNNEKVVVKVIKDDFKDDFLKDINKLKSIFNPILFLYPKLKKVFNPLEVLNEIERYTVEELNLLHEIYGQRDLEFFYEKYKERYDLPPTRFHKIYSELSSDKILISEKIEGYTFDELLNKNTLDFNVILDFFKLHTFYVFTIGRFHSDIHPGNVLFGEDKNIYMVDTGALSKISFQMRIGLLHFFAYLGKYDYLSCAKALQEMSLKELDKNTFEDFSKAVVNLYADFKGKSVGELSLTKKMMDTVKLAVNYGMEFDKNMFSVIKSFMYLDGMVLRCKPDEVLIETINKVFSESMIEFENHCYYKEELILK